MARSVTGMETPRRARWLWFALLPLALAAACSSGYQAPSTSTPRPAAPAPTVTVAIATPTTTPAPTRIVASPEPTATPTPVEPAGSTAPTATVFVPPGLPPAWPFIFSGDITAGGAPVPAGYTLVSRIDDYESKPVVTLEGRYLALLAAPLQEKWFDRPITFHLIGPDGSEVKAEQTETFVVRPHPTSFMPYALVFPQLP